MSAAVAETPAEADFRTVIVLPSEVDEAETVWRPWLEEWANLRGADLSPVVAGVREGWSQMFLTFAGDMCQGIVIASGTLDLSGRRWLRLHVLRGAAWLGQMQVFEDHARAQGLFGILLECAPEYADDFPGYRTAGVVLSKVVGAQ